jgi:hypothetical protein
MNKIEYMIEERETSIGDLYNGFSARGKEITDHGHEMINVPDMEVLGFTSDQFTKGNAEYLGVKRIVRHAVDKQMYMINTIDGDSVTVSEDHGCLVNREGTLKRVKPTEVVKMDMMCAYDESRGSYTSYVHSVTKVDDDNEYIYDIEMDTNPHTFFADDILVHNSLYINAEPIVDYVIGKDADITDDNIPAICDELDGVCDLINLYMTKICKDTLHSNYPTIAYKRECFASEGIFTAKKRYALHVRDDEGKKVNKFKYTGIELKKSEHPPKIKTYLKHVYDRSLEHKWISSKYGEEINKIWDEFCTLPIAELALYKGYGTEKTMDGFLAPTKGTGGHAKAALFYNQLLDELSLNGLYSKIRLGDKVRFAHINKNNVYGIDIVAWPAHGTYPTEFGEIFQINYRKMFEKTVLNALKAVIHLNGWASVDPCDGIEIDVMNL